MQIWIYVILSVSFLNPVSSFRPAAPAPLAHISRAAHIPQAHPIVFAVTATCIKTTAADFLAQKLKNGDEGMDWRRLAGFTLYGAIYLGLFQFWLYTEVYTKMFPGAQVFAAKSLVQKFADPVGAMSILRQVSMEAFVHWPLAFVPSYYVMQEIVNYKAFRLSNLVGKIKENWWDDMKMCWSIWLPAATFNFGTLPVAWQVPFTTVVGFAYTTILSIRRGKDEPKSEKIDQVQKQQQTTQAIKDASPAFVKRVKVSVPAISYPMNSTMVGAAIV